MNHTISQQYWLTKKSVSRKLGGKEDDCIVSSDAELDAKLELFRSIAESCVLLQRVVDAYQERLCFLAQEENALGRYLKEYGKAEKNASAGQIMSTAGKALAYTGHQRLTIRPPLLRLHQEVETFRGRAISDTRSTVLDMEKTRTEYRAALSWMKSASAQLDPDTGHGLEKFRKAQSYVRASKVRFDTLMLASLQKIDLLAAARCNMFSHALLSYQSAIKIFNTKASDTLMIASTKLSNVNQQFDFCMVPELSINKNDENAEDKCKETFFNADYSDENDKTPKKTKNELSETNTAVSEDTLLGETFYNNAELKNDSETPKGDLDGLEIGTSGNAALLDLSWPSGNTAQSNLSSDFLLGGDFMPSSFLQDLSSLSSLTDVKDQTDSVAASGTGKDKKDKTSSQMSWLSLFAELDPLANQEESSSNLTDRA